MQIEVSVSTYKVAHDRTNVSCGASPCSHIRLDAITSSSKAGGFHEALQCSLCALFAHYPASRC